MQHLISKKKVLPSGPEDAEILIILEAPGYEEDLEGIPAIGEAGKKLDQILGIAGFLRKDIRVTNTCNYRPVNNKWDYLEDSWQLKEGISEGREYIKRNKHRLKFVVLAGAKPLEYFGNRYGIEKWRSSVFEDNDGVKYYATYHPSAVLYNGTLFGITCFDYEKLARYCRDGYQRPVYNFILNPTGLEYHESIHELKQSPKVYVDIESVKGTTKILCCGFATSPSRAIVFANNDYNGMDVNFFNALSTILEDEKIEKVFQNGFGFDIEMLLVNGIDVKGYVYDTMIGAHVIEPEHPYSLEFLTTIYTDQPYYKDKGKSAIPDDEDKGWSEKIDKPTLHEYNATDCVVTAKIAEEQIKEIQADENLRETLSYKLSLIPLGYELSRNGMEVNTDKRELLRSAIKLKWKYYQEICNTIAHMEIVGFKSRIFNVKSPLHLRALLLDKWKLPERKHKKTKQTTFDEDAIVSYLAYIQQKINDSRGKETIESWQMRLAFCKCMLLIRGYRQLLSNYINIRFSNDGRVRSVYNFSAATETGRGSSHKWIDGSGLNAQTWPRESLELDDNEVRILKEKGLIKDD